MVRKPKQKDAEDQRVPPIQPAKWQQVVVLPIAAKEGWDILTPGQYLHVKDLVKQLVGFGRKDYETNLWISQFGDFWELKDKGGTLGKKNIRIYFGFRKERNEVVVLSTYKKEDDGPTPNHIMIRVKSRWRRYVDGEFGENIIVYTRPGND